MVRIERFSRTFMVVGDSHLTALQMFGQERNLLLHLTDPWIPAMPGLWRSSSPSIPAEGTGTSSAVL